MPNFIDTPEIEKKTELNYKGNILFCGRLTKAKGTILLIKAFEKIKNKKINLLIAGDGSEKDNLIRYVSENNINNIEFLGHLKKNELDETYQSALFLVIPSISIENYPFVATEALSNSIPVVAFDSGGLREIVVNNKTGFLVDRVNIEELTNKMNFLIENPEIARKMGENGLMSVKKLNREDYYKKLIEIYSKTINNVRN